MQKELTYILGAGASFQSMPTVKSFPGRFSAFVDFLKSQKRAHPGIYESAYEKAKKALAAFKTHQSFDTYFKKLFHIGLLQTIIEVKKILNLYFIWEHLSDLQNDSEIFVGDYVFGKQSTIDKRYDALIAGLLKPTSGKSDPYCPVNFITWNYDMNLLMSLKNYFLPQGTFKDFLNQCNKEDNIWQIGNNISVINMNGYFYSTFFASEIELVPGKRKTQEILYNKLKDNYFSNESDSDAELIKFAWESSSDLKMTELPCVKKAIEKISSSDNVVLIGYTFPLYNRLIDFKYFNGSSLREKNIYIQDPNASEIKKSLVNDFNIYVKSEKIEPSAIGVDYVPGTVLIEMTNCDSFLIPSDIFKYRYTIAELFN